MLNYLHKEVILKKPLLSQKGSYIIPWREEKRKQQQQQQTHIVFSYYLN